MKKHIIGILALCISLSASYAQTASEIVDKHIASRGGADRLRAITSLEIHNTLEARDMEFENNQKILVGKAMRSDTKIMGNDMVQAFDGAIAWAIRPSMMGGTGEPEPMPEAMTKGIKHQTDPFPLLDYTTKNATIELIGTEKVKETDCIHIKLSHADGNPTEFWLNAADGLIVKQLVSNPMGNQEVYYSNYQQVDGVKFPFTLETENPQAGNIKITTQKIIINGILTDADFKMPAK
jgi:hypothetical protein